MRADAQAEAWRVVNVVGRNSMTPEEQLGLPVAPKSAETDEERGAAAVAYCLGVVFSTTYTTRVRLKAMRIVLPYLMPKPAGQRSVGLEEGLGWLRELAREGR